MACCKNSLNFKLKTKHVQSVFISNNFPTGFRTVLFLTTRRAAVVGLVHVYVFINDSTICFVFIMSNIDMECNVCLCVFNIHKQFISDSEKDLSTCFAGVRVDHVRKLGQGCVFVAPFSQQAPTQ